MPEVASEEQAVRLIGAECGKKAQLRDADILGFVDHGEVERHMRAGGELRGESTEQPGIGDEASGLLLAADAIEHRPEHGTLRLE